MSEETPRRDGYTYTIVPVGADRVVGEPVVVDSVPIEQADLDAAVDAGVLPGWCHSKNQKPADNDEAPPYYRVYRTGGVSNMSKESEPVYVPTVTVDGPLPEPADGTSPGDESAAPSTTAIRTVAATGTAAATIAHLEREEEALLAQLDELRAEQARRAPDAFCEHVLRDTRNGGRIKLQPAHHHLIQQLFGTSKNVVIRGVPESGKTEIAMGCALYIMGKLLLAGIHPTFVWGGETFTEAKKRATAMAEYIPGPKGPTSPAQEAFASVYPEITRGSKWSEQDGYKVACNGRESKGKDRTIRAGGLDTGIHGSRIRFLIADDCQTYDNQRIRPRREAVDDLFHRKFMDRTVEGQTRTWFLTNAWWEDSTDARLIRDHKWKNVDLVVDDNPDDDKTPEETTLYLPALWGHERIRLAKANPIKGEAMRRLYCRPLRISERSRFRSEFIELCSVRGLPMLSALPREQRPDGWRIFHGVDMGGFAKKTANDSSVIFTILLRETMNESNRRRRILSIQRGQWDSEEFIQKLLATFRAFGGEFIVESNAAQLAVAQMAAGRELPIRAFTTGANKHDPVMGVQSLATEMAMGQWEIPQNDDELGTYHPEIVTWISEMEGFDPEGHTGDSLMASWFARMGAFEQFHGYSVGTVGDTAAAAIKDGLSQAKKATPLPGHGAEAAVLWEELYDEMDFDADEML